jgi:hypothetical protein
LRDHSRMVEGSSQLRRVGLLGSTNNATRKS